MQWIELKPTPQPKPPGRRRPRPTSSVWTSPTGYQVARVTMRDERAGWAIWLMTRGGWRRILAGLHLADAGEAMVIAALEFHRRQALQLLPGARFVGRIAGAVLRRVPVDPVVAAMIRARPTQATRSRLMIAYMEAVIRGDEA